MRWLSGIHPNYETNPLFTKYQLIDIRKGGGIFKLLRSPGIDFACLCSLAGRYGNPAPTRFLSWMKEVRDDTWRVGGLPTLPGLYLSTFQPSQRGFFRVHTSMWRERESEPEFSNFSGPQASIPQNWQIGFRNPLACTCTTIYAVGIDSLEIFALLNV